QIRSPLTVLPASDIYSLGCTLYYAVTGKVPYPGGDSRSKCRRHLEETPWHPRRFAPELADEIVELIADMMEKDPQLRINSAAVVAERLLPWCDGETQLLPTTPGHSPWMPAPPPAEPAVAVPDPNSRDSLSQLSAESSRSGGSPVAGMLHPLAGAYGDAPRREPSATMLIAVVLAIAIPISLFVGAVIGFIVRSQM